ncbi:MAG: LPS export ABC transporter periplasmic protein LptC, partial [Betaproteobacteria bacterium]|nr:LPS export ABC transporter periplasmic protein LptC [Betaproteobacteria bacterium]
MLRRARFRVFRLRLSWPQLGLLLSLCLVASASAYLALTLASRHDPQPTVLGRGQADYYATTVHMLRYNHQGVVSMQLRADRLDHLPDREQLRLIQPRIWLSAGASDTQISALEGITSDDGETASLSGSVVIVRKTEHATSLQIRSERAFIDATRQRVEMPDEVRIERGEHWV